MSTIKTTRELSKYVNKKLNTKQHMTAFSDKGKTHQRMSWYCFSKGDEKLCAKINKKLTKSGIIADVYFSKGKYPWQGRKINIKMTLAQHAKLRYTQP